MNFTLLFSLRNKPFFYMLYIGALIVIASACNQNFLEDERMDFPPHPPEETSSITAEDILTLDKTTGRLRKDGKDYYGAGVNYYDAFYRVIIDRTHNDTSYRQGIRILQEKGIPFIRFSVLGFYPNDLNYYQKNESDYFAKLDAFVSFARNHNIGLIPSFFWNHSTVPDFVGEPVNAWADLQRPGNKTNAFMTTYVRKMVTRYGNDPAIWAWEFGNEANIKTDPVGMTFNQQPWLYPITSVTGAGGLPTTRSFQDTLSTNQLITAFSRFRDLLQYYEDQLNLPHRAIFSGNNLSNWGSYSRYHGVWKGNTQAEYETIMLWQNGNLGTVTIHPYPNNEAGTSYNTSISNIISGAKTKCDQFNRALFIGEFGVPETYDGDKKQKFREYVDAIKENNIQLSALWVFDTLGGETGYMKNWVVTPTFRSYQLDGLVEINNYFKSKK